MLRVHHVTKRYGQTVAVDELSMTVNPGEIVGLLGRNGAGKTSLFQCIAGISRLDQGSIEVCGHSMQSSSEHAKMKLAYLPDVPEFFDGLTVVQHAMLWAMIYGTSKAEAVAVVKDCGLDDHGHLEPAVLSRGEQQLFLLRLALARKPSVLVLDEPLTGLDPIVIQEVKALVVDAARAGASVLLSSHNLPLVAELCTRVCFLVEGRLMTESDVQTHSVEELESRFLDLHAIRS